MTKFLNSASMPLVLFGAVNYGLIGLGLIDVIGWAADLVRLPELAKIVQILIGVAGVWLLVGKKSGGKKK